MRAILVCVDYADILQLTLPYNAHHFEEIWVVTTRHDTQTQAFFFSLNFCDFGHKVVPYYTDAFYDDGADFNKWKALEEALDVMGRRGWLCIMDADVLWPKKVPPFELVPGCLYTPKRRMKEDIESLLTPPPESEWTKYPLHRQQQEFAGYSQIFHADDPVLGSPPWHETNWKHAGGADSFFQMKWPDQKKVRPPFEVLHLGPAGENWCGRASGYIDGRKDEQSLERLAKVRNYVRGRSNKTGPDRFSHEKL